MILRTRPGPVAIGACTAKTQRCPDARDYRSELGPCCREHLVEVMTRTADALDALGVPWWADYGTLLGAVRNPLTTWADYPWLRQDGRETAGPLPGIVPHDKDGDLGVMFDDWAKVSRELPRLLPRPLCVRPIPPRHSLKVLFSPRNATNVDLFFWRTRADGTLYRERYCSVDAFKGREFHRDQLFPLTVVEWEGRTLPAPVDPEAFLAMRYGPKWRTPVAANNDGVRR